MGENISENNNELTELNYDLDRFKERLSMVDRALTTTSGDYKFKCLAMSAQSNGYGVNLTPIPPSLEKSIIDMYRSYLETTIKEIELKISILTK